MKKILTFSAVTLVAGAAMAATPHAPAKASGPRSGILPIAVQSYADAYDFGVGPAHFLLGTSDPNDDPGGNGICTGQATGCDASAGDTTISRAAYVGSILTGPPNGQQMVAVAVYDASQIHGKDCTLRLNNFQNFTGYGHALSVKVLENRGDNDSDFGAEDIFKDVGPFGVPTGGSAGAIITLVTDARTNPQGQVAVPSQGALTLHPFGPGPLDSYETYDRTIEIDLGDIKDQIKAAKGSGVSYNTCRYSCLGAALDRNVDCDLEISNPLYIAVSSVAGGNRSSSAAIQDGIAVDNIIHLHGDCDFDGSMYPGDIEGGGAGMELVCK